MASWLLCLSTTGEEGKHLFCVRFFWLEAKSLYLIQKLTLRRCTVRFTEETKSRRLLLCRCTTDDNAVFRLSRHVTIEATRPRTSRDNHLFLVYNGSAGDIHGRDTISGYSG